MSSNGNKSAGIGLARSSPGKLYPRLVPIRSRSAEVGPNLARFGPSWPESERVWPTCVCVCVFNRCLGSKPKVCRFLPNWSQISQLWPQSGRNCAGIGQIWQVLAKLGQISVEIGAEATHLVPCNSKLSGRILPKFGRRGLRACRGRSHSRRAMPAALSIVDIGAWRATLALWAPMSTTTGAIDFVRREESEPAIHASSDGWGFCWLGGVGRQTK